MTFLKFFFRFRRAAEARLCEKGHRGIFAFRSAILVLFHLYIKKSFLWTSFNLYAYYSPEYFWFLVSEIIRLGVICVITRQIRKIIWTDILNHILR